MTFVNTQVSVRRKSAKEGAMETIYSFNRDLEIDTSQIANEMSLINEETNEKPANVRFEHIDGHVLIVSLRDIEPGIIFNVIILTQ